MQVPSGPPISESYREVVARVCGLAILLLRRLLLSPPGHNSAWCSSNMLGLGPSDRRCKSCRADQFQIAAVAEDMRHPSSKRNDAGGNPAGSASLRRNLEALHSRASASGERPGCLARLQLRLGEPLPGGVKVARRPVKPFGVGASPTLAAPFQLQMGDCRFWKAGR